jgi:hypothetical protein
MKKNSLTAFKRPSEPILPVERDEGQGTVDVTSPSKRGKTGPKPKAPSEKRSHRVMLSLTPSEAAILKEKAGLAGEATVVLAFLKEQKFFE